MKALICGVTGQDGHYLSAYLKKIGYEVYGGYRRSTHAELPDCEPVPLEMTEYESIHRAIRKIRPNEVYNLAAQSHVGESFGCPLYTNDVNYMGVLRLLECIRETGIRLYQASTSEMFGGGTQLTEESRFAPRSPYAVSKVAAHHECGIYRRAYGVNVSCGILFNHESPLRGKDFVTRKITYHTARKEKFTLANLDSVRDWGHAADYVRAMHLMLQVDPDDFVIATGESHSIQNFVDEVKKHRHEPDFTVVEAQERPWDVKILEGNPEKAERLLGWKREYTFSRLVKEMLKADYRQAKQEGSIKADKGVKTPRRLTREGEELLKITQMVDIPKKLTDIGARLQGSNSYQLIKDHGFEGILVDMNEGHCNKLRAALPKSDIRCLKVTPEIANDLVPEGTGILCIDIDGNDYWVWKAIEYNPEVVIIEVGKKGGHPDDWIAPYDENSRKRMDGTCEQAMTKLAEEKGYRFHKKISVNMIYLRNDVSDALLAAA